jgi:hypothetical protein
MLLYPSPTAIWARRLLGRCFGPLYLCGLYYCSLCTVLYVSLTSEKMVKAHRVEWPLSVVHSIMMEKFAQAGMGAHTHPLSLYLPSRSKLQQIHSPPISSLFPIHVYSVENGNCLLPNRFLEVLMHVLDPRP